MKALVTGASGFVGSHLVVALAAAGAEVTATDLAPPPGPIASAWPGKGVRFMPLDVADAGAVSRLVGQVRPSHIVHAAALTPDIEQEARSPARIVSVNIGGAANIVDAALSTGGVARLVLFSSSAVYNGFEVQPDRFHEGMVLPPAPASLYAVTKFAAEGIAQRAAATGRLSVAALRVASVYGPFERPTDSRRAMRLSLMHRLADATVNGLAVRCGADNPGRDWVHGDDVGRAVVALLAAPHLAHRIYNVASGRLARWQEIVGLFNAEGLRTADGPAVAEIAMRAEEHRPAIDIDRLAADTGFSPAVTLADGVRSLVAHHRRARAA